MRAHSSTALLALAVATVLGVAGVATQQTGTLTLRNGQTLMGELVDLGGVGFTFRVNGQNREIPKAEVTAIDFGGDAVDVPPAARTLAAETSLVLMRNGSTLEGDFYDIGGTQPLRLTFRTAAGERVIDAGDVRRIYLTRVAAAAPARAGGGGGQPTVTITVSSRQPWTPTGLTVRQGQTIRLSSGGEVVFTSRNHRALVTGSVDNLRDTKAPMPGVPQGALIGRIGVPNARISTGPVFAIGNLSELVVPGSGPLFLGVNDSGLDDNQGSFTVAITVVP
jgi:hypothetical protein